MRRRGRPPKDPVALRGTIGRVLQDLGHSLETPAARLLARWEDAVGPELAAHCEPTDWKGAELEVTCDAPGWAQHLKLQQGAVLGALAEVLGDEAPRRLRVRVR